MGHTFFSRRAPVSIWPSAVRALVGVERLTCIHRTQRRGWSEGKERKGRERSASTLSTSKLSSFSSSLLHDHPSQCVPESVILVLDVERSSCQSRGGTVELDGERKEGKVSSKGFFSFPSASSPSSPRSSRELDEREEVFLTMVIFSGSYPREGAAMSGMRREGSFG